MPDKLLIITGQTATGKTKLAQEYTLKLKGELVNFDSRQIYQYLDVITGKDLAKHSKFKIEPSQLTKKYHLGYYSVSTTDKKLRQNFGEKKRSQTFSTRIWLYDLVKPDQYFSSFDYVQCAQYVLGNILQRGKTPILVGGSYFYLKHLLYGVKTENIRPDWKLRRQLGKLSVFELQKIMLKKYKKIFKGLNDSEKNNPQRLIRKIEILRKFPAPPVNGTELKLPLLNKNNLLAERLKQPALRIKVMGLRFSDTDTLKKRIKKRVEQRMKTGAIAEVKKILKLGYQESDPGLKTIGYPQLISYLRGEINLDTAIRDWTNKELQYAKRQYTFMKTDPNIKWQEV